MLITRSRRSPPGSPPSLDCRAAGTTLTVRDAIERGVVQGARILTTGLGITITGGHFNWFAIEADTDGELRKAARTLVKRGADHIKLFGTGAASP